MKNCVVIVKTSALDLLCKNYPRFSLRKWFDLQKQKYLLNIEDRYTICCGFDKNGEVHFTYDGGQKFTDFFVSHRIEFSFSETEDEVLNMQSLYELTS